MRTQKLLDNRAKCLRFQHNSPYNLGRQLQICRLFGLLGLSTNERRMIGRINSGESAAYLPISRTSSITPWRLPAGGGHLLEPPVARERARIVERLGPNADYSKN
jgi:hypothetical protein